MTKKLNEEYIRVAAYYIWEQAGRPEGREQEFWNQACDQLMKAEHKVCSKKASKPAAKKVVKAPAKKADSLNLNLHGKPSLSSVKPFYGIKK